MPYEDTIKSHIELLIDNRDWTSAYAALQAYIDKYGSDYWAKNFLALVEANLKK